MKQTVLRVATWLGSFIVAVRGISSYAPLTEGWWHVYSRWMSLGKLPYRDFELLVPPGYPILLHYATMVLGEDFLTLRVLGAVQIAFIGMLVWTLTRRLAGELFAVPISIASVSYLCSGTAFISYDYVYTALLFFMASLSLAVHVELDKKSGTRQNRFAWVLVGLLTGFTFLIKQTQGLASVSAALLILVASNRSDRGKLLEKFLKFTVGNAIAWAPVLAWLVINGVSPLNVVHAMTASQGPKGSTLEILFSWILDVFKWPQPIGIVQTVTPFVLIAVLAQQHATFSTPSKKTQTLIGTGASVGLILSWFLDWHDFRLIHVSLELAWHEFVLNATVGSWVGFAIYIATCWSDAKKRRLSVLLGISIGATVWACAMSAGITEIGAFLSVALGFGALIDRVKRSTPALVVVSLVIVAVAFGSWSKYENAPRYSWWGYSTATPELSVARSNVGLTKGLHWDAVTLDAYQKTQELLAAAKLCGGEVIAFPHVPLFQLDAGVLPMGRLANYWYDFSTQKEIRTEIRRIENAKISAIVLLELPDAVVEGHEILFNNGKPLAHRALYETLTDLGTTKMNEAIQVPLGEDAFWHVFVDECTSDS